MSPKLSIIITSYNIEKYIGDSIQNVIDQTISDIEIIIVDDGSSDKTCDIIREYAAKDNRIVPILMGENSPGGVATPANIGIEAATGDYIGFADGDDLYDPTMFEKLYLSAEINSADIAMCNFMEFESESGLKNAPFEPGWNKLSGISSLDIRSSDNKKMVLDLLPVPWRKIYKRELLVNNHLLFPVGDYFFEDNGFHWFTTLNANRVSFVDEILCFHRRNRVGQTMSAGGERLLGVFHQHEVIYNYLVEKKLVSEYRDYSLNWLIGHLSWVQQELNPKFSHQFYQIMISHISKYTQDEVRKYLASKYYDRKSIELVVCLLRKDEKFFIEIMNGKQSLSIKQKIIFNYYKLGMVDFILMSIRHLVYKVKGGIKYKHVSNNELRNLLWQSNERIERLNSKINDLERIIETGFILTESKLNNKK
ncbi:glycosyltransferase [Shimwellia blattae]|uniref:Putative glycosyltransferase n=1 Tax=Shimwellia blattae (strain ATCC 29907 / DSM 4481 / JCM 1650 / NBRC 105725 / CDC 9005-74) TaxID=630626 RepID=I2B7Q4_SHIBC|nr:glycosyltransferase [Shimwellia blattae]AFJ46558.1 putative glycosyltransferase [Shimwellia blattae DSM 4481 = NBRC 105725]GAB80137.1 putative glycosyltransferase [Shimwellia blattae DSM 4481 = NBRC 105725]VDY64026.1 Spore coat polysaccharide biosynthesis protein spsA [Shimwellia blattae]VEC22161.1 Spore coat polysaccharide biosynthesis protein spsA [Shimwellia blattae]